uniref:Uncharacterized protein n=1 Tax=Cacopsylla melanoneura TaxID=428564 RepID=A0A8D8XP36_9HEMI
MSWIVNNGSLGGISRNWSRGWDNRNYWDWSWHYWGWDWNNWGWGWHYRSRGWSRHWDWRVNWKHWNKGDGASRGLSPRETKSIRNCRGRNWGIQTSLMTVGSGSMFSQVSSASMSNLWSISQEPTGSYHGLGKGSSVWSRSIGGIWGRVSWAGSRGWGRSRGWSGRRVLWVSRSSGSGSCFLSKMSDLGACYLWGVG